MGGRLSRWVGRVVGWVTGGGQQGALENTKTYNEQRVWDERRAVQMQSLPSTFNGRW